MSDWIQGCGFIVMDAVADAWRAAWKLVTEP
jgi:hypothetical protein